MQKCDVIITLVFEQNAKFVRRKLAKITENCDHNFDPRIGSRYMNNETIFGENSRQIYLTMEYF
jgi:hypothetical protein